MRNQNREVLTLVSKHVDAGRGPASGSQLIVCMDTKGDISRLPDEVLYLVLQSCGFDQLLALGCVSKAFFSRYSSPQIYKFFCTTFGSKLSVLQAAEPLNWREAFTATFLARSTTWIMLGPLDSGKSSCIGRLQHDLHIQEPFFKNRFEKLRESVRNVTHREILEYAWLSDNLKEERERGITIVPHPYFLVQPEGGKAITLLDTPGHRDYPIPALRYLSVAQHAIFVVASMQDEAFMLFMIHMCKLFSIKHVVCFVNTWQYRYVNPNFKDTALPTKIKNFILGLAELVDLKAKITFLSGSVLQGQNIVDFAEGAIKFKNKGSQVAEDEPKTLWDSMKKITNMKAPSRPRSGNLRLVLLDCIISGSRSFLKTPIYRVSPLRGVLHVGDELWVTYRVTTFKSRGQVHHWAFCAKVLSLQQNHQHIRVAYPGDIVAMVLSNHPKIPYDIWPCDPLDAVNRVHLPSGSIFFPSQEQEFACSFTATITGVPHQNDYEKTNLVEGSSPQFICHGQTFTGKIISLKIIESKTSVIFTGDKRKLQLKEQEEPNDPEHDEIIRRDGIIIAPDPEPRVPSKAPRIKFKDVDTGTCEITVLIGDYRVWMESGMPILVRASCAFRFGGNVLERKLQTRK